MVMALYSNLSIIFNVHAVVNNKYCMILCCSRTLFVVLQMHPFSAG